MNSNLFLSLLLFPLEIQVHFEYDHATPKHELHTTYIRLIFIFIIQMLLFWSRDLTSSFIKFIDNFYVLRCTELINEIILRIINTKKVAISITNAKYQNLSSHHSTFRFRMIRTPAVTPTSPPAKWAVPLTVSTVPPFKVKTIWWARKPPTTSTLNALFHSKFRYDESK